jgi:hypothetical protein
MPVGRFLLTPLQCLLTHQRLLHAVLLEHQGPSIAIEHREFILCCVGRPGASEDASRDDRVLTYVAMKRDPVPYSIHCERVRQEIVQRGPNSMWLAKGVACCLPVRYLDRWLDSMNDHVLTRPQIAESDEHRIAARTELTDTTLLQPP